VAVLERSIHLQRISIWGISSSTRLRHSHSVQISARMTIRRVRAFGIATIRMQIRSTASSLATIRKFFLDTCSRKDSIRTSKGKEMERE
jgi:hypothetical protein